MDAVVLLLGRADDELAAAVRCVQMTTDGIRRPATWTRRTARMGWAVEVYGLTASSSLLDGDLKAD
jgi:hypothetical protein